VCVCVQVHHSRTCATCLRSLATADMAFPESFGLALPFADKLWPKFSPVECATCTELFVSIPPRSASRFVHSIAHSLTRSLFLSFFLPFSLLLATGGEAA